MTTPFGAISSMRAPEEEALWTALIADGSPAAREALFVRYQPLARKVASRHFLERKRDIEFPDLCQSAYAGLLQAIDRFDPKLGTAFSRFAERRISGSVLDGLSKSSEVREQLSFRRRFRSERMRSLAAGSGDPLTDDAAFSALADAAISLALGFMLEGTTLFVAAEAKEKSSDAYESLVWKEAVGRILVEMDRLPERERFITQQHYLNSLSFEQIGSVMMITKGRVSQLHKAALGILKARCGHSSVFGP